jgi:tetratricopeptide (TPR) repeat protein
MIKYIILFNLLIITTALPAFSRGNEKKLDAERFVAAGKKFYKNKMYHRAIIEFRKSLEIKESATVIFNIAQAYYKAKNHKMALHYFKRFLPLIPNVTKLTKEQKDSYILGTYKLIKLLENIVKKENKSAKSLADKKRKRTLLLIKEKEKNSLDNEIILKKQRELLLENQQKNSITKEWWFWGGVGTTVLFAATTAYFGFKALSKNDEWQSSWNPDDRDSAKSSMLFSDISAVGAIIGVGSVAILSFLHFKKVNSSKEEIKSVVIAPGCTPSGCTIAFSLSF